MNLLLDIKKIEDNNFNEKIKNLNITIVGLGLIGGSYAMSLKNLNPKNLWAVDINESTLKKAEELEIIDKGFLDPKIPLEKSDIIIISLYPELCINFLKDYMNYFKKDALITDTTGLKTTVVKEINGILREDLDFIGGHPMAGRECSGFMCASSEIFKGASYILTPIEKNKEKNLILLKNIIKSIGFKKILELTPEEHDKMIAFTSHLPHIVALALVNSCTFEDKSLCIGGSFRDATRVAQINSQLWPELLLNNKNNVLEQIDIFEEKLNEIKQLIVSGNKKDLKESFEKATWKKEHFL